MKILVVFCCVFAFYSRIGACNNLDDITEEAFYSNVRSHLQEKGQSEDFIKCFTNFLKSNVKASELRTIIDVSDPDVMMENLIPTFDLAFSHCQQKATITGRYIDSPMYKFIGLFVIASLLGRLIFYCCCRKTSKNNKGPDDLQPIVDV